MKKLLCILLAAALLMSCASALADTTIDRKENRGIVPQAAGENMVPEGVSPTTGLTLADLNVPEGFTGMAATGRYLPMLAQISNEDGGVGNRAPWGASYADIVYEAYIDYRDGATRLSFLFNDVVPDSVGPIRSMRVVHVWLREEWGAAYMFHGQQEYDGSNVVEEFRKLGHDYIYDDLLFNGWAGGKVWNKYFTTRKNLSSPNNKNVMASGIYSLVPEDYVAPNHAFRFTDEAPEGDPATSILVSFNDNVVTNYRSVVRYDADLGAYARYMRTVDNGEQLWVDKDEGTPILFANVIVQFTPTDFNRRHDAPIQYVMGKDGSVAEGNADFFMGGKHIAGYWKRDSATSRTVYYGPDGQEISLQRGKTLIVIFPDTDEFGSTISYSAE